jgi:hypothetical protein
VLFRVNLSGMSRGATAVLLVAFVAALTGCASSSSGPAVPTVAPAKTFQLAGFKPTGPVQPGHPFELSFRIDQPSGEPLVSYRRGAGPHTGVHVIVVSKDLSVIIHRHPPIAADGSVRQPITLPAPGPYRVLVDAYPNLGGPRRNFQLSTDVSAAGSYEPEPLPAFHLTDVVNGYRITLRGTAGLRAIQPASATATVTDSAGKPPHLTPWFGALAHAIFFRAGSLDYFHTHVCGPNTPGCTTTFGTATITGRALAPGKLTVGILLPLPGTWRLFLQFRANGETISAPFTLKVR